MIEACSKSNIFISQQKYTYDLLRNIDKLICKPASIPIYPNHKLGVTKEDALVDK